MGLMIAPYNNAMRLGQGFNSFTHEICVNDAVVISPQQAENVLTNDGNTMRLTALVLGRPSAWTKQDEVVMDVSYINEANQTRQEILDERSAPGEEGEMSDGDGASSPPASDDYDPESGEEEDNSDAWEERSIPAEPQPREEYVPEPATSFEDDLVDEDEEEVEEQASEQATPSARDDAADSVEQTEDEEDEAEEEDSNDNEAGQGTDEVEGISSDEAPRQREAQVFDTYEPEPIDDWEGPVSEFSDPPVAEEQERTGAAVGAPAGKKGSTRAKPSGQTQTKQGTEKDTEAEKQRALREQKDKELERINHRKARQPNMLRAASAFKVNIDLDKMARQHKAYLIPERAKKASKVGQQTKIFDIKNSTGVSQTVVFQSRFVEKVSEIVSDMGVSAALSVKKGSVGGAGRASFIKTDKFEKNDLNYYISVKVVNQSINFKDALEFNKLDNVSDEDFRKVFGDCFISGFLEGGELNALVSMKILNKAKFEDVKAEGSVTLGFDAVDIKADGAFKQAKANLNFSTETTIQVSWIGGGIIKPPEESWTIDSLTRAASRFPDNVAQSPQRIYALLTKYETLRSYQVLKPIKATELDYKSAALYTSDLLDTFTAYRALYSRLSAQISDVQRGQIKFNAEKRPELVTLSDAKRERAVEHLEELTDAEKKALIGVFPATIDGLDDARGAVRDQMNLIVARVDSIAQNPAQLSDIKQQQPERFLPIFAFETLLPSMQSVFRNTKRQAPLSGEKMYPEGEEGKPHVTDTAPSKAYQICPVKVTLPSKSASGDTDKKDGADDESAGGLEQTKPLQLRTEEKTSLEKYLSSRDEGIEDQLKLTPPLGSDAVSRAPGKLFSALDFVNPTFLLEFVSVTLKKGVITGLACEYANGMSWKRGTNDPATPHRLVLDDDERITSVIITAGSDADTPDLESILALKLVTNDGKSLHVEEKQSKRTGYGRRLVAGRPFYDIRSVTFGSPLERGYAIGFWGRSQETGNPLGIFRLGVVWCNTNAVDKKPAEDAKQSEAKDKDAAHERQVDDYDKVLREYKELKEEHARLQLAKSLVDQQLVDQREQHERDTTDMKSRYNSKLKEADDNKRKELEEAQEKQRLAVEAKEKEIKLEQQRVAGLEQSQKDLTNAHSLKLVTMYKTILSIGAWVFIQHKSGHVLTLLSLEKDAVIKEKHNGWEQKFRLDPPADNSGLDICCEDPTINKNCWLINNSGKLGFKRGNTNTISIEPVPGDTEWCYLKCSNSWVGTEGGSMSSGATIVTHKQTPGPADQWKFVPYDPSQDYKSRMTFLHKLVKNIGKQFILENKCGLVLDCHLGEIRPIIAGKHGNWNQRYRFDITKGWFGIEIYCTDDPGSSRWLASVENSDEKLCFSKERVVKWVIEPISEDSEYFYVSDQKGRVLGARDGRTESLTELIKKVRTDADQWKLVWS